MNDLTRNEKLFGIALVIVATIIAYSGFYLLNELFGFISEFINHVTK